MTQDFFLLMQKLQTLFPEHLVTGRVKSARAFLDKCGRLCQNTQAKHLAKTLSALDIIDGCGCRITCSASSQIYDVVQKLKNDFEFLELDNKYTTIRKDGAYKVIPCTMKDLNSGLVFELQITTLTSTIVADLFHNVIYKRNAIGLNPTEEETQTVLAIQRLGALTETVSLVISEPIVLTKTLKTDKMVAALDALRQMVEIVLSENLKASPAKL